MSVIAYLRYLLASSLGLLLLVALPTDAANGSGGHASPHNAAGRKKIAIVGGGPSGTSAAYWLSKAQEQLEQLGHGSQGFDLHLYEKETHIGGRTKVVHPFDDDKNYDAVELGASIFADVNRNMVRFAKVRERSHGLRPWS